MSGVFMSSPFSLRLHVHDVGRADAFDKCAIPKTNGHDNRQSTIAHYGKCMPYPSLSRIVTGKNAN